MERSVFSVDQNSQFLWLFSCAHMVILGWRGEGLFTWAHKQYQRLGPLRDVEVKFLKISQASDPTNIPLITRLL